MINLNGILKKFEEAMASTAFAEEGEFDTARQLMQQGKNSRKKVLLGTGEEEIDLTIIGHALKLCHRVGAGLEILHVVEVKVQNQKTTEIITLSGGPNKFQGIFKKMGIIYNKVLVNGTLESELVSHVAKRRDVMLVVLGTKSQMTEEGRINDHRRIDEVFSSLRCPLVIYGEPTKV